MAIIRSQQERDDQNVHFCRRIGNAVSQTQSLRTTSPAMLPPCPPRQRYGVGMRVFTDRPLLRQIRAELVRNAMEPAEIAALENVPTEVLIGLLERGPQPNTDPTSVLRQFAADHEGYRVLAWRTTRKRASRLHLIDPSGVPLCGTPPRSELSPVGSGACSTCVAHAQLEPPPGAVLVVKLDGDRLPWKMPSVPSAL